MGGQADALDDRADPAFRQGRVPHGDAGPGGQALEDAPAGRGPGMRGLHLSRLNSSLTGRITAFALLGHFSSPYSVIDE
ncbi:MAG: hypothetical protein D3904_16830 [Candidatus Electrothrix sp. EH2]|nr:hypothetical protein [Candidatus Electrothrix sp. EH2]